MTKRKLIILLLGFSLCFSGWHIAEAFQQKSIEKAYYVLGYKSVLNAIQETELYYKIDLNLPKKLPPLDFTHSFGRFNHENGNLEIEYINEERHFNYIINVFPVSNRINLFSSTDSKITLEDGTQAYYSTLGTDDKKVNIFMFKKGDWTYLLSIEESLLDNPLPTLEEIANSF